MQKIKRFVMTVLSSLSVLLLFCGLVGILILLIAKPALLDNTKNAFAFASQFTLGAGAVAFIRKRIQQGIVTYGTLSKAVQAFLESEPLIHLMIWVLIAIQFVMFSYLIPIHHLNITVVNSEGKLDNAHVRVVVSPPGEILSGPIARNGNLIFRSRPGYFWGDSCTVNVTASGWHDFPMPLKWSGFSFLEILSGYDVPAIRLDRDYVQFQVKASPDDANIHIKGALLDTVFTGLAQLRVEKGALLEIVISSKNREPIDTHVSISKDTTLSFHLDAMGGSIILHAANVGGDPESDMKINIDGKDSPFSLGDAIPLSPGSHRINVSQDRPDAVLSVREFTVIITPGAHLERHLTATLKPK